MPEIRVALVGVGNSASALVQGTQYYKDAKETETVPGLHARELRRLPHQGHTIRRGF